MIAQKSGTFDLEIRYQLQLTKRDTESGLTLPIQYGLVNRLNLNVIGNDVDVFAPQAVATQRELAASNTVATVVLAPGDNIWVGWKPRTRDVRREKAVFYAEFSQLYSPGAGVIEGVHNILIRPAQGELSELIFSVPPGATVTSARQVVPSLCTDVNVPVTRTSCHSRSLVGGPFSPRGARAPAPAAVGASAGAVG